MGLHVTRWIAKRLMPDLERFHQPPMPDLQMSLWMRVPRPPIPAKRMRAVRTERGKEQSQTPALPRGPQKEPVTMLRWIQEMRVTVLIRIMAGMLPASLRPVAIATVPPLRMACGVCWDWFFCGGGARALDKTHKTLL